jgi:hypothetical protein
MFLLVSFSHAPPCVSQWGWLGSPTMDMFQLEGLTKMLSEQQLDDDGQV